jgi:branched-subunit amino acid transport protein
MKALGPVALAGRTLPATAGRLVGLVAVPVLAALVVVQTVGSGDRLVLDARLPAMAVAAVLVWRRAPFLAVVVGAAVTAAGLRLLA